MEYRALFLEALQSLRKNVMRTSLTMLGIVIGIAAVILIVSIGQGAVKFITVELSTFGTDIFTIVPGTSAVAAFAGGKKNLTMKDADAIRNDKSLSNIKSVIPIAIASVPVTANGIDKTLLIRGVTHEAIDFLKPTIVSGSFITEEDDITSSRVAVIGIDAAKDFFGENTDPVGSIIRVDNKPFRIAGVAQSSSGVFGGSLNNTLYIPTSVVLSQISGLGAHLQEIGVSVKNTELINQTIEDVSTLLRDRHNIKKGEEDDFLVQSFADALSTVQTITSLLTTMVAAISGISLLVGGVGVMNIMLVTVTERTREIGLLKAIGARQKDILAQFLTEAIVITLAGGVIGIMLGIAGAFVVTLFSPIPFVISIPSVVIAVGVAILVGVVFGIYPARKAANMRPIDALRYE